MPIQKRGAFLRSAITLFGVVLFSSSTILTAYAAPQILWRIGATDHSGKEFALFGNYPAFAQRYPGPFTYRIGVNHPSDWPYIQPGPDDTWANGAEHPLTIQFNLNQPPSTQCELVIHTVSTQGQLPPTLQAKINGATTSGNLPPGPGDAVLGNEKLGNPLATRIQFDPILLRSGTNRITLTITAGSWLLYDSILLETDPGQPAQPISNVSLQPSIFYIRWQGRTMQSVILSADDFGEPITAQAEIHDASGSSRRVPMALHFGHNSIPLPIPPVSRPTAVSVALSAAGRRFHADGTVAPQRKWTIYIVPSVHIDNGYTALQSVVRKLHEQNLDQVLAMCRRNPNFKWNLEGTWEVMNYLHNRPQAAKKELLHFIHDGQIEVTAGYFNMLTGLMSDEEMNRYAYVGARLHREFGIPITAADLTDVPSANWGLASALGGSGVHYFAEGINQTRALTLYNSGIHTPFYWEGPDGSKVLTWLSNGYGQSLWLNQNPHPSMSQMASWVNGLINGYDNKGYPFRDIYVYGALYENMIVNPDYGSQIAEWNQKYAYPRLVLATEPQFFHAIIRQNPKAIPTIRGGFGSYWEDGAGSSAFETALNRQSQQRITTAETLWSLARLAGNRDKYPLAAFDRAWTNLFLYDEHTWGAAGSVSDPNSPETRDQWAVKKAYALEGDRQTRELETSGLEAFMQSVPARKGDIVVVNPLSWPKSGIVRLPYANATSWKVVDSGGHVCPAQSSKDQIRFYATDVPPLGYRIYRFVPVKAAQSVRSSSAFVLLNRYYRLNISPEHGVVSVVDRRSGRELMDSACPYSFGQVLYAAGGDGTRLINSDPSLPLPNVVVNSGGQELAPPQNTISVMPARITSISPVKMGAIYSEITIHSTAPSIPMIETRIRLYNQQKRIEVIVKMTKKPVLSKEAVYVAFPFKFIRPHFLLDTTDAIADPTRDFVTGACTDWYAIRDWVSCRGSSGANVVWTSPDAPLITLCDINRGRWLPHADITNGWIFSYVMNNYWFTNYRAEQGGDLEFRYDLTSSSTPLSTTACEHFGKGATTPLPAGISSYLAPPSHPSIRIMGSGVEVVTIKGAEDGNGTIIRLRNLRLRPAIAQIQLNGARRHAELDNLVEERKMSLKPVNGELTIRLKPQQTATVRIY